MSYELPLAILLWMIVIALAPLAISIFIGSVITIIWKVFIK